MFIEKEGCGGTGEGERRRRLRGVRGAGMRASESNISGTPVHAELTIAASISSPTKTFLAVNIVRRRLSCFWTARLPATELDKTITFHVLSAAIMWDFTHEI